MGRLPDAAERRSVERHAGSRCAACTGRPRTPALGKRAGSGRKSAPPSVSTGMVASTGQQPRLGPHRLLPRTHPRRRYTLATGALARERTRHRGPRPYGRTAAVAVRAAPVPDLCTQSRRRSRRRHHAAAAPGHTPGRSPAAAGRDAPRTGAPPGRQGPSPRTLPAAGCSAVPGPVGRCGRSACRAGSRRSASGRGPGPPGTPRSWTWPLSFPRSFFSRLLGFCEQTAANWMAESGDEARYAAHWARGAGRV